MTQDDHLESGHQTNKTVNDQDGDDASTSGRISAKNSGKRNSKSPSTKLQQTDRRIKQSNKSAIGKRSTGANVKVSIVERDRNGQKSQNSRKIVDQSYQLTVGNRSDHSTPRPDDTKIETEMTVINQPSSNESIRDSIRSDIIDHFKDTSDTTVTVNDRIGADNKRVKLSVSENSPTTIDTDLQSDGSTSGTSPTISQHTNNSTNVTEKKDAGEDHTEIERANKDDIDGDKDRPSIDSSANNESRIKPIPKTDDPIERLNALRANISSTLKEVKAVLDKHTPPQRLADEGGASNVDDDGVVKFRFVRRVRSKSFIKFDDEEIICNVPEGGSSTDSQQRVSQESAGKLVDQIKDTRTDKVETAKTNPELTKERLKDKNKHENTTEKSRDTKRDNIETVPTKDDRQNSTKTNDICAKASGNQKQDSLSMLPEVKSSTEIGTSKELVELPESNIKHADESITKSPSPKGNIIKTKKKVAPETNSAEKDGQNLFKNKDTSKSDNLPKELSPNLEKEAMVGKNKEDEANETAENQKENEKPKTVKNEKNLKRGSALQKQDNINETTQDIQATKELSSSSKSNVEQTGKLDTAEKVISGNEPKVSLKTISTPTKQENASKSQEKADIMKPGIRQNNLKPADTKVCAETRESKTDTKASQENLNKDTMKAIKDTKSEKEKFGAATTKAKTDPKSSQETTIQNLKSTPEESTAKSKEIKTLPSPQRNETQTTDSPNKDSKISNEIKTDEIKPQGEVTKKQTDPNKDEKSVNKKVVQNAEGSKKETKPTEAKAPEDLSKKDAKMISEKSETPNKGSKISEPETLPKERAPSQERRISKSELNTNVKSSPEKVSAKLPTVEKDVKPPHGQVNQKLDESKKPSKCLNENVLPPQKNLKDDPKSAQLSSSVDGKTAPDKQTANTKIKLSVLINANKSLTTTTAIEPTTKGHSITPQKLATTTTPGTNLKSDSEPTKLEGSLNEKSNMDAKASASGTVSEPQLKPPLQPPRKPVETCANIEQKVLEILSQKTKKDDKMIPTPETVRPTVQQEVPKTLTDTKHQVGTSNVQNIEQPAPSTSPKTTGKDKPDSAVKESVSKTPVSLRVKRASLTESSKVSMKDKLAKRSSIGSESELAKIAAKSTIGTVKKTAKDETTPKKKPNIIRQTSLDLESRKTKSASVSDIIQNENSGLKPATITSGAFTKTIINQSDTKIVVSTNSSVAMKDAPSASVQSKNDSTTEITPTPSSASIATLTQPIAIKSASDAKIPTVPTEKSLDVIKPLISSADKLVSSESVGPSSKNSAEELSSKMTVVKKDIVSNIAPSQPLDTLTMKAKESHGISESLQNNLDALSKYSAESKPHKDPSVVKTEPIIVLNGEVKPKDISIPALKKDPVDSKSSPLVKLQFKSKDEIQECDPESNVHSKNKASQTPAKLEFAGINKKELKSAVETKKDIKEGVATSVTDDVKGSTDTVLSTEPKQKEIVEIAPTAVLENEVQNVSNIEATSAEDVIMVDDKKIPLQKSASTDTDDLTQTGESESDSGPKSPTAKKLRKTKKVIIKRVKRRLSLVDEAVPEPEVCEKPIAEPPITEDIIEEPVEEPVEEEPPAPKGPKSCLIRRSYEPGDIVLYADRIRKNVVKWKKATVLDKITDHSYKLAYDDIQKPAHISYIKKFTEKKVQFGGKEYLEIDYAQDEYESSDEEVPYNIWARA